MLEQDYDVVIVGGGAAGFFTAVNLAEARPELRIVILEKAKEVLQKVKISGGGRCNVTHAEFDPKTLTSYYPRGEKELLGPFHKFMTGDTVQWFEDRGVPLKAEEDGRMFPISDNSQSIIDCLLQTASRLNVEVLRQQNFLNFELTKSGFEITTAKQTLHCRKLVITAGSSKKIWSLLEKKGHTVVAPVPSLFTFNIENKELTALQGISQLATVALLDEGGSAWLEQSGPVLITHWGVSGPGVLKLSAVAARELFDCNYEFNIRMNWLPESDQPAIFDILKEARSKRAKQLVSKQAPFEMTKRLWRYLCQRSGIDPSAVWADQSNKNLQGLSMTISSDGYSVNGKSTYKEEFVTAGGVALSEINFKHFESKKISGLYMAGEVINVDALTGGFNFQNAWTGGYIIARSIAETI